MLSQDKAKVIWGRVYTSDENLRFTENPHSKKSHSVAQCLMGRKDVPEGSRSARTVSAGETAESTGASSTGFWVDLSPNPVVTFLGQVTSF